MQNMGRALHSYPSPRYNVHSLQLSSNEFPNFKNFLYDRFVYGSFDSVKPVRQNAEAALCSH